MKNLVENYDIVVVGAMQAVKQLLRVHVWD